LKNETDIGIDSSRTMSDFGNIYSQPALVSAATSIGFHYDQDTNSESLPSILPF